MSLLMSKLQSSQKEFRSHDDWREFQAYIRDESRYVLTPRWEQFLQALLATSDKREYVLKKNERMARARIGIMGKPRGIKPDESIRPLPYEEMIGPPREKAVEGRLNPSGIPYLYLANNKETAIAEVRPWVGAYVTVVYFKLTEDQRLIDLTKDFHKVRTLRKSPKNHDGESKENLIWSEINQSFSEPVSPDDKVSQYVHTQYITEIFKRQGFDGVRYKSSLHKLGYNYLVFNPNAVKFDKSFAVKVEGVSYRFRLTGDKTIMKSEPALQRNSNG
jgi:hypothetical protein